MKIMGKAGTSYGAQDGVVNISALRHVVDEAAEYEACIVTSGFKATGEGEGAERYEVGRRRMVDAWSSELGQRFGGFRYVSRGSLATDAKDIAALMEEGSVPVVNGHYGDKDFGSNDWLAAEMAVALGCRAVVFFSGISGMWRNYGTELAKRIPSIPSDCIDEFRQHVGEGSAEGTGGMMERLDVAEYLAEHGIVTCLIGFGDTISDALHGRAGTLIASGTEVVL